MAVFICLSADLPFHPTSSSSHSPSPLSTPCPYSLHRAPSSLLRNTDILRSLPVECQQHLSWHQNPEVFEQRHRQEEEEKAVLRDRIASLECALDKFTKDNQCLERKSAELENLMSESKFTMEKTIFDLSRKYQELVSQHESFLIENERLEEALMKAQNSQGELVLEIQAKKESEEKLKREKQELKAEIREKEKEISDLSKETILDLQKKLTNANVVIKSLRDDIDNLEQELKLAQQSRKNSKEK